MNKFADFIGKNADKIFKKIEKNYEINSHLTNAVKASICIDLVIFFIETLNKSGRSEKTIYLINNFVDALDHVIPTKTHYKVAEFANSREEAAHILSELYQTGDLPETLAKTNFDLITLIKKTYNYRVAEYFSEEREALFVISASVPMLLKHANIKDADMNLINSVDNVLVEAMALLPNLINNTTNKSSVANEKSSSNCYIVTAASGSEGSDIVKFYRNFRDEVLVKSSSGQLFIKYYYKFAPPIAAKIENSYLLKRLSLILLYSLKTMISLIFRKAN